MKALKSKKALPKNKNTITSPRQWLCKESMFNIYTFSTPGFLSHKCDPNIHNEQLIWHEHNVLDIKCSVETSVYQQVLITTFETEPTTLSNVFLTTT